MLYSDERMAKKGLGLSEEASEADIEKETHRIFRSTFSTPDGKKALNILLTKLGYFSTAQDWVSPAALEKRHILADFAEYLRIELLGCTDTISLTESILEAANKEFLC